MSRLLDYSAMSLQDALDLAILIEEEAKERYDEFVNVLGSRYPGDASDVFRTMAANEAKHQAQLTERRNRLFGTAPSLVNRAMITDVEAPDYGKPRAYMSIRQAFEVALESEEKARDFFTEALKHAKDPDVKALFSELRDEETEHRELLFKRLSTLPAGTGPDLELDEADEPPAL